ncbi:hypothetical protein FAF44_35015 [Nonomuraea sp. MG754425]|uniref:class III lanthionine synthetase LanKC n=1 Tax=Nonomuraea sp. MG754425 TaxID=2570319 RepID=UPI001F02D5F2|nr:class III lanthionine synthetase LanKC [Nonomuraea sp. MG754425]MCF6473560.1 hypothetical protein [Nonomuraea sp. MG754425]
MTTQIEPPPEFSAPDMFPTTGEYRDLVAGIVGTGWRISPEGPWYMCQEPAAPIIEQGWKIHVSSIPQHATQVLDVVARHCAEHGIAFKFALDPMILTLMNGKHWPRGGAGKFVTIYPAGTDQFKQILADLYSRTSGVRGPYILSDRRYRDSRCLYYRYGGISPNKKAGRGGTVTHVLRAPDGGDYVDERNPYYAAPPWVSDPFGAEAGETSTPGEIALHGGRYVVTHALSHSARGGTYLARDSGTGELVVVKEARPDTEWIDGVGDAVAQLKAEARALRAISASGRTPRYLAEFSEWENYYLAETFAEGRPLASLGAWHLAPYLLRRPGQADRQAYAQQTARLWQATLDAMERIHDLGYVVGDVSPFNIIASEDLDVVHFIDLEGAVPIGARSSPLTTPGFAVEDGRGSGPADVADDYYGLAATLLSRLMPTAQLVNWAPETYRRLVSCAAGQAGVRSSTEELISIVTGRSRPSTGQVERMKAGIRGLRPDAGEPARFALDQQLDLREFRQRLEQGVVASLRYPQRGKIPVAPSGRQVFSMNRYCAGYGAAGIARALRQGPDGELTQWLGGQRVEEQVSSPGLYTGLAGIAWTLRDEGLPERAAEVMDAALARAEDTAGDVSLFAGSAGLGLACLHFFGASGDERYLRQAHVFGDEVLRGVRAQTVDNVNPGLAGGVAGLALFLLYLSLATGEPGYAKAGREGLLKALRHARPLRAGDGLQMRLDPADDPFTRIGPHWDSGSAGVGTACLRYGAALGDAEMLAHARELAHGCEDRWVSWSTLATGLTGLGMYLMDCARFIPAETERWRGAAEEVAGRLTLYRIDHGGHLYMPGETMRTVSADLLTGASGALMFTTDLLEGSENRNFLLDHLIPDAS